MYGTSSKVCDSGGEESVHSRDEYVSVPGAPSAVPHGSLPATTPSDSVL